MRQAEKSLDGHTEKPETTLDLLVRLSYNRRVGNSSYSAKVVTRKREGIKMAVEAQSPQDLEFERKSKEVEAANASRTGIGTRMRIGKTRGKGSTIVTWEAFDDAKPETMPKAIDEFMEVTGKKDEPTLVGYLIAGFNEENYTSASDPLADYVDPSWPPEVQTQFRMVARNYSRGANVSIEEAVNLVKPGFVKQFSKKTEAEPASV